MSDALAWLRAQLDDDERVARAAERYWHGVRIESATASEEDHARRWDPARVLAEIEAKRRILDLHPPREIGRWQVCAMCRPVGEYPEDATSEPWPCRTIRLLAQPYADRPGFPEEWR